MVQKDHHFVPQFFFRNFSSRRHIALYNIATRSHVPRASIRGQCQEDYLYGKDTDIEPALARIEGDGAVALRKIIDSHSIPEDAKSRAIIKVFFAMQAGRTPSSGRQSEAIATQIFRSAVREVPFVPEELRPEMDRVELRYPLPAAMSLASAVSSAVLLTDLSLALISSDQFGEFIFGDNPVARFNQWAQHGHARATGLGSSGLQLFLPISPGLLLFAYDGDTYKCSRQKNGVISVRDETELRILNSLQMLYARENLYSSGSPIAIKQINELPFFLRAQVDDELVVEEIPDARDGGKFVHAYNRPLPVTFNPSFVTIRRKMRQIPDEDRERHLRPRTRETIESRTLAGNARRRPGKLTMVPIDPLLFPK